MRKFSLVEFSVDHPKTVVLIIAIISLLLMTQFLKARTDTNPKNMLPATSDVRVWNVGRDVFKNHICQCIANFNFSASFFIGSWIKY